MASWLTRGCWCDVGVLVYSCNLWASLVMSIPEVCTRVCSHGCIKCRRMDWEFRLMEVLAQSPHPHCNHSSAWLWMCNVLSWDFSYQARHIEQKLGSSIPSINPHRCTKDQSPLRNLYGVMPLPLPWSCCYIFYQGKARQGSFINVAHIVLFLLLPLLPLLCLRVLQLLLIIIIRIVQCASFN